MLKDRRRAAPSRRARRSDLPAIPRSRFFPTTGGGVRWMRCGAPASGGTGRWL